MNRPNAVFGVDVSHYEGRLPWDAIPDQGFDFVYAKASQGDHLVDDQFKNNWAGLGQVAATRKLYRGAYHFMSSDGRVHVQADNFVKQLGGKLDKPFDLPPSLDMEWDFRTIAGKQVDSWTRFSPQQIIQKIQI